MVGLWGQQKREGTWGLQVGPTSRPCQLPSITEDDSNSYENVLICKPSAPDSGKVVSPKKGRAEAGSPS